MSYPNATLFPPSHLQIALSAGDITFEHVKSVLNAPQVAEINHSESFIGVFLASCAITLLYDLVTAGIGQSLWHRLSYGPQTAPV